MLTSQEREYFTRPMEAEEAIAWLERRGFRAYVRLDNPFSENNPVLRVDNAGKWETICEVCENEVLVYQIEDFLKRTQV